MQIARTNVVSRVDEMAPYVFINTLDYIHEWFTNRKDGRSMHRIAVLCTVQYCVVVINNINTTVRCISASHCERGNIVRVFIFII